MPDDNLLNLLVRDVTTHQLRVERRSPAPDDLVVAGKALSVPLEMKQARKMLRQKIDDLAQADAHVDELAAQLYAPAVSRSDLSAEDRQWTALLHGAAQASLQGVQPLLQYFKQRALAADIDVALDDADLAARLRDSLATVSAALVQALPRAARRAGSATLLISFGATPEAARFAWLEAAQAADPDEPVPLLSLLRHRFALVGDLCAPAADLLARCTVKGLQEGWAPLPHFSAEGGAQADPLRLTWQSGSPA